VLLVSTGLGLLLARAPGLSMLLTLAGATYLAWLGVATIRHSDRGPLPADSVATRTIAPLREGFVVGATNPKSLAFLAALLPRSVEPAAGGAVLQMAALGVVFCIAAILVDSAWVLAAARLRRRVAAAPARMRWATRASGAVLVTLGLLLLLGR
jgi:threonine/homoserine/homoserine lactone efflux protein